MDAIAVAAPDTDFLFLLERLKAQGVATLALLPSATEPGVAQAFQAVAEVERFRTDEPAERRPTKKIVLQAEGWSSIEDLGAAEFGTGQVDPVLLNSLRVKLCELNYLQGHDQPLLPAVAKLFAARGKALTAWPKRLAFNEALQELSSVDSWPWHSPRRVFVLPCGTQVSTKAWLEAFCQPDEPAAAAPTSCHMTPTALSCCCTRSYLPTWC